MYRTLLYLIAVILTAMCAAQQAWVPGEVLVRLGEGRHIDQVRAVLEGSLAPDLRIVEARPLGKSPHYAMLRFEGPGMDERKLMSDAARLPGVEAVSLNYKLSYLAQPNDAQYSTQWNLTDIHVEPVWDHTTGGTMANGMRIGVALSDLAIQTNHPDLQDNIWSGSPYMGNGADHGTEVASVMGAVGNNGIGISGVNWDVEIVSSGTTNDLADAIDQIEYATSLRQQFNASNGAGGLLVVTLTASYAIEGAGTCNGFLDPLFTAMTQAGILFVTAGPNSNTSIEAGTCFPANCALAEHIVVTSYGQNNETPFAFGPSTVHLLAPGVIIPTATVGSGYTVLAGNSFAVPLVAGAVALLYSAPCPSFAQLVMNDPVAARQQVKDAILNHTTPFPGGDALTITGGKLNVLAAYDALMSTCAATCTEYTIDLTTTGDPVTSFTVTDWRNREVLSGGGNTITTCLENGCYTINLNGPDGLPMEAEFTVTDASGIVAMGNSSGGIINLSLGDIIPGCTVSGSSNHDPLANCNDGSCCADNMVEVVIAPEDFATSGTTQLVITSGGNPLFNGTVPMEPNPEFGVTVGVWEGCVANGCFSVLVSGSSVPLHPEGYIIRNGDNNNLIVFPSSTGFAGAIGSGAQEVCDGTDNDCDGLIDEDFIWYADADHDGWSDFSATSVFCTAPGVGYTQQPGDCDDTNAQVFPGAPDDCATADGLDNDCDGQVDEEGLQSWYEDLDGDGYGTTEMIACGQPANYSLLPGDCDDGNATVHPDHEELCDGLDNDCNFAVDEIFYWYPDADGDGWAVFNSSPVYSCDTVPGHTRRTHDCNDSDPDIFPGATEHCDGFDNNCDEAVDEGYTWFVDADGDGYGDWNTAQISCTPLPGGSQVGGDCDDTNPNVTLVGQPCNDGNPATDVDITNAQCQCIGFVSGNCPAGEVEDCNGHCAPVEWIGDGICDDGTSEWQGVAIFFNCPTYGYDGGDCSPCVAEVCDGIDNDCDGQVDEGVCNACSEQNQFVLAQGLRIQNGQLTGTIMITALQCGATCDDGNSTPAEIEACVSVCLSQQLALGVTCLQCFHAYMSCYNQAMQAGCSTCVAPCVADFVACSGLVDTDGDGVFAGADCDDENVNVYPGAQESCDGLDNDCDGETDERMAFADADGDGYGDPLTPVSCSVPGSVSNNTDCDDTDPQRYPGGPAACPTCTPQDIAIILNDPDLLNNSTGCLGNCFNTPDPEACISVCVQEQYGLAPPCADCVAARVMCSLAQCQVCITQPGSDACQTCLATSSCNASFASCSGIVDSDADGVIDPLDCNDQNADIHPGASELCDGLDNDCDGLIDEGAQALWYHDADGDGFGDLSVTSTACPSPPGFVSGYGDCDDTDPLVNPGAVEVCDGLDNDCNGYVDDLFAWYADADDDGFGTIGAPSFGCTVPALGVSQVSGDCNDADPAIHPNAEEHCDGIDGNCDGEVDGSLFAYADADGDGLGDPNVQVPCSSGVTNNSDCNDQDPTPCDLLHHHKVIATTGSHARLGTHYIEWSLGEPIVTTVENAGTRLTQGFHQNDALILRLNLRAYLQGAYTSGATLMRDDLRANGLLPLTEPYTEAGYAHAGAGGETTTADVLAVQGPDAIVDWVVIELRDPNDPAVIMDSRSALLQRDGDVVDLDGSSAVRFLATGDRYYVALLHRNHLPVMTAGSVPFPIASPIDMSASGTALYGTGATVPQGSLRLLWCGDVNADGVLKYTGASNDRDPILLRIGGTVPTNVVNGYHVEDVNLDGAVKYTGSNNDRDPILQNIGGSVPTNVRNAQMP